MTLPEFFKQNTDIALAFSGGTDSSYLLYAAVAAGADVTAYYVSSAFQPQFEYNDAKRIASLLSAELKVVFADVLATPEITENPKNRCYYCKRLIFSAIADAARSDGKSLIIDGTNASDNEADRPGITALRELSVRSPLKECELTKHDIRRLSKQAGLFTWDKPAYACLATRIPAGEPITKEKLIITERAEDYLFSLGFSDFRVRLDGTKAKIQLPSKQMDNLLKHRKDIYDTLSEYYSAVMLDLEARDE